MAITDREMFRQTSYRSPDVTVIGESGGGVRPEVNIPPPTAEIDIGGFDQPEFEVTPNIGGLTLDTNVDPNIPDTSNQIVLSTGETITIDPEKLKNIVNSENIYTLDVFGMLNNPKVILGSNVRSILQEAMRGRESSLNYNDYIGGVGNIPADAQLLSRMGFDRFYQGAEDIVNFFGRNIDKLIKNPSIRGLYRQDAKEAQLEKIAKGEVPDYEPFDFYESPIEDSNLSPYEAQLSGLKTSSYLDDMYRGAQIQSEIDDLDKPSQTQMESDVSKELPTEEIAANTIETQEDPTIVSEDIDTQADLERRIKEGQSQMAIDKIDRESLTEKEKEERIREDIDETEFEVSKEQQDKFFADEQKYIKDLAIAETFGGQKFKDYLGSMGKQLARTGSFMGIPLGTADFVESEEGKRAAEAELEGKFAIEQIKQTGEDTGGIELKATDYRALTKNIKENVPFLEGNIQSVKLLEKAIDIVNTFDNATGGYGLFQSYLSDIQSFFGKDTKNFEQLPPYKQVGIIIESIRQKNLQAVLGESGRTISDRDRDIITRVFGDQRRGMASKAEILQLLQASLNGFKASGKQYKDQIVSDIELLNADPRYAKQVQVYNSPEYQRYSLDYDTLTETLINTKKLLDSDIINIDL